MDETIGETVARRRTANSSARRPAGGRTEQRVGPFRKSIRAHFTGNFWRGHSQRRQGLEPQRGYDGIFLIGPFQLPALPGFPRPILNLSASRRIMPLLAYERMLPGSPSFLRQVETPHEQVLQRRRREKRKSIIRQTMECILLHQQGEKRLAESITRCVGFRRASIRSGGDIRFATASTGVNSCSERAN